MGGAFFAIPIIGVQTLDGYRKKRSTHPTKYGIFNHLRHAGWE
jgi:hypothetical protein